MFTSNYKANLLSYLRNNPAYLSKLPLGATANGDEELKKYYTFDELGHIMVATTEQNHDVIDPELKNVMEKVVVFFGAWTAALTKAGKTLFDFDAINKIIGASGFFINVQKEERSFSSSSTSVSLDTTIIQDVLSGGISGGGLAIAQRTLAAIGKQIKADYSDQHTDKEICHLLFVVESLLGTPIVSLSLFHTKLKEMSWVTTTNCSSVSHKEVNFAFSGDDYLFVDPEYINKYSPEFKANPEYEELIQKLVDYINKPGA
jgi:hypothetical protein